MLKNKDVKNSVFLILKNEDNKLPCLSKMKTVFPKQLETEDPSKNSEEIEEDRFVCRVLHFKVAKFPSILIS